MDLLALLVNELEVLTLVQDEFPVEGDVLQAVVPLLSVVFLM